MSDNIEDSEVSKATLDEMRSDEHRLGNKSPEDNEIIDSILEKIPSLFSQSEEDLQDIESLSNNWQKIKEYIESSLEGEAKETALGYFMKSGLTFELIRQECVELNPKKYLETFYSLYKKYFPDLIPDGLVEYAEKYYNEYSSEGIPHFLLLYGDEKKFAESRLTEIISGQDSALAQVLFDIRQREIPGYFHGFNPRNLKNILDDGLIADQFLDRGNRSSYETAFPMFISFTRPVRGDEDNGYSDTTTYKSDYGAATHHDESNHQLTAMIDIDYILPRSFAADRLDYKGYVTAIDEYESTVSKIPAEKIIGLICGYRSTREFSSLKSQKYMSPYIPPPEMIAEKDRIIEIVKNSGRNMVVYGVDGTLLWPVEKSPMEVSSNFENVVLKNKR